MEKNYPDSYYCPECAHDWLIHPYVNRKKGYVLNKGPPPPKVSPATQRRLRRERNR